MLIIFLDISKKSNYYKGKELINMCEFNEKLVLARNKKGYTQKKWQIC